MRTRTRRATSPPPAWASSRAPRRSLLAAALFAFAACGATDAEDDLRARIEVVHFVRSDRPLCRAMAEGAFADAAVVALHRGLRRRFVETSTRVAAPGCAAHERSLVEGAAVATLLYLDGAPWAQQRGFAGPRKYRAFLEHALQVVNRVAELRDDPSLARRIERCELEARSGLDVSIVELEACFVEAEGAARRRAAALLVTFGLERGDIALARRYIADAADTQLAARLAFAERRSEQALALVENMTETGASTLDLEVLRLRCLHELQRDDEVAARLEEALRIHGPDMRLVEVQAHIEARDHSHGEDENEAKH